MVVVIVGMGSRRWRRPAVSVIIDLGCGRCFFYCFPDATLMALARVFAGPISVVLADHQLGAVALPVNSRRSLSRCRPIAGDV